MPRVTPSWLAQPYGLGGRVPRSGGGDAAKDDLVAGQSHAETLSSCLDRLLEVVVGECFDLAGDIVDEVVVMALWIGDLVASHDVGPVKAVE